MVVLDRQMVEAGAPEEQSWESATKIVLSKRGISDITVLGQCHLLQRLDLAHNAITSVQALGSCTALRWLNLSHNSLGDLDGLQSLTNLNVLNVSHNSLSSIEPVTQLPSLNALIASDNEITSLPPLNQLSRLNTLVVSSNLLSSLGAALSSCSSLLKLSLSHNDVTSLKGAVASCTALQELRFAHNSVKVLPPDLASLSSLRIVDAGHNAVAKWRSVSVLSDLPRLRQLNLMGNPLAAQEGYRTKLLELAPRISVLDGRRIDRDLVEPQGEETGPPGPRKPERGRGNRDHQKIQTDNGHEEEKGKTNSKRKRGVEEETDAPSNGKDKDGGTIAKRDTVDDIEAKAEFEESVKRKGMDKTRPKSESRKAPSLRERPPTDLGVGATKGGKSAKGQGQGSEKTKKEKGDGKRQKTAGQLSAKETGVLKVVLHAGKGSKKVKGTEKVGAPFQLQGAQPGGELGVGGPSSWE